MVVFLEFLNRKKRLVIHYLLYLPVGTFLKSYGYLSLLSFTYVIRKNSIGRYFINNSNFEEFLFYLYNLINFYIYIILFLMDNYINIMPRRIPDFPDSFYSWLIAPPIISSLNSCFLPYSSFRFFFLQKVPWPSLFLLYFYIYIGSYLLLEDY